MLHINTPGNITHISPASSHSLTSPPPSLVEVDALPADGLPDGWSPATALKAMPWRQEIHTHPTGGARL
jgi:hypothetical protein